ncbi:MAG TPA: hypothetical protein VNS22_13300 [Geminicoccus sp.]|uniref:hypothetical protein n=1 Tax=Geminicoccus sp. TaxID=2024832 RepID=UPI002B6B4A2B|nr:hypothetical protein [Geminicoccus sp.]HWL69343.1 hypothetical protein [Geminicoccus sp.]
MSTIVTCRLDDEVLAGLDRFAARYTNGSRSAALERLARQQLAIPAQPRTGGQDRASGAAAAAFGKEAAAFLAGQLRATRIVQEPANIYGLPDGTRVLIKSAKGLGERINVLPGLLGRFHYLHAGFWDRQGTACDLFELPADLFVRHARKASQGKYLQIDRGTVECLQLVARVYRRG